MTHYRDSDLERMLADLESDLVERKESLGGNVPLQAERIFYESRLRRDRPFDVIRLPSATLPHFDLQRFEGECLVGAVAPDVLAASVRTQTQRLAATEMVWSVDEPIPTVLGTPKVPGFVQKFGAGIATARRSLADNGNPPPEFAISDS